MVKPVLVHVTPPFVDFSRLYVTPSCEDASATVVPSGQQPAFGDAVVVTIAGNANTVFDGLLVRVVVQNVAEPYVW